MNNDYKIIKKCHSVKVTGKKNCLQSGLRLATSELPNLTPHKSMPKDGFLPYSVGVVARYWNYFCKFAALFENNHLKNRTNKRMKKFLLSIPVGLPSALMLALILYLSLATEPVPEEIPLFVGADKLAHVVMYFLATLVFIMDYAKFKLPHHSRLNIELAITSASIMLGLIMEILQLVMRNGRNYELGDWIADIVGAVLALIAYRLCFMHKMRWYLFHSLHRHHYHHHHRHRHDEEKKAS